MARWKSYSATLMFKGKKIPKRITV